MVFLCQEYITKSMPHALPSLSSQSEWYGKRTVVLLSEYGTGISQDPVPLSLWEEREPVSRSCSVAQEEVYVAVSSVAVSGEDQP